MEIKNQWNGIRKGESIRVVRDVYVRDDGRPGGSVYYEPPGKPLVKRGMIGTFSAKTEHGVLVYFKSGGGIMGLVLEEFAIEKITPG
jgi:hypothetical protein